MTKKRKKPVKVSKAAGAVQAALDRAKAYVMECNVTTKVPQVDMSLGELEKEFDLAGARLTYAMGRKDYWHAELYRRAQEFNKATIAYKMRKHGFTDEQVREKPRVSTASWAYAK